MNNNPFLYTIMSGEKESTQGGIAAAPAMWQDGKNSRREVRLGVVMYGGVSLAVYINGVAHEFFRAVRGRGVYRLIKALTDSDIIVDVISGTSAGGINGIMLSYALCNERDFSSAATLWRTHGDISKLLRSPKEAATATSILDSEGYYQPNLEKVFASMERYVPESDEDNSTLSELDLFVTGTDVDGNIYTLFDDAGHPIDVKDHRSVFLLSHRKGRKEPFNTDAEKAVSGERSPTIQALAKLCRITSCFPGAFAPVCVKCPESAKHSGNDELADDKLQKWGNLGKAATFLDGGVLNNKPFSHTLKAIFSRAADREVKRALFYVDPDPERMKQLEDPTAPNFVQTILAALIGIPGYQSIAGDLKLLREHNSKLEQYNRLVKGLDEASAPGPRAKTLYERCRRVFICDRVLQGVFRVKGRDAFIDPKDRDWAAKLANEFDQYNTDWNALFSDFDVYYRLRRLTRVTYLIHDLLYNDNKGLPLSDRAARQYTRLWQVLNQQTSLYEVLRSAMEGLIDNAPIPWKTIEIGRVWRSVRDAFSNLLDDTAAPAKCIEPPNLDKIESGTEWLPPAALTKINDALRKCCEEITHGTLKPIAEGSDRTLLERLDEYEKSIVDHFTDPGDRVRTAYAKFMDLDTQLFPLEMVGDLHERDIIETIRISPRDAQKGFSLAEPSDKVTGTMVYHFGAFFKRSWRSNDILWGRLDGLCQLVETLLEEKRLRQIVNNDKLRKTVYGRFFVPSKSGGADKWNRALDPANLFPKAGARTQAELRKWLESLLSEESAPREQALKEFSTKVEVLIEAAQLEVINEDLPNVIFDAVSEQAEWNHFKVVETKKDAKPESTANATAAEAQSGDVAITAAAAVSPFVFQRASGQFDPFFATLGAAQHMRMAMLALDDGSSFHLGFISCQGGFREWRLQATRRDSA